MIPNIWAPVLPEVAGAFLYADGQLLASQNFPLPLLPLSFPLFPFQGHSNSGRVLCT